MLFFENNDLNVYIAPNYNIFLQVFTNNIFMYFNYHAKVKKKIAEVGVEKFEFVEKYNNISPALLIYFKDGSVMPIREHKFLEYVALFDKNNDFGG